MSKYSYGKISKSNDWYIRLKEWKGSYDNKGDLLPFCRVIKIFRTPDECIKYIEWMKEKEVKKWKK